jgi:DNA-binding transcriptional regulator YiaG
MPNIGSLLKDEIARLCRKEIRRQVEPVRKNAAAHRRDIAALKRKIATLERQGAVLVKRAARSEKAPKPESTEPPMRFVAKGLVSLRTRLGLSAGDFGQLIGVSGQSVYNWEKGKATPRREQLAALAAVRGIGKGEAQARLAKVEK